jgi:ABC-type nitrate/sulfonate/bicarbonate transport system substrate-binding protein
MQRVFRGALCGAAALLAMTGVSHADDSLRVAKGASRAYSFMLLDVGLAAGIFKKHNLNIEESSIDGAARLHQAMVADSIDIALGAGTDIAFIAKGSPEKGVGVMATNPLNMALTLRADSPIKNMDGLKGKTIGVTSAGSLTDWFARQINYREGWKGKDAVTIAALGSADGTTSALIAGNIDALVGSVEGGYALEQQNRARVLFTFGDFVKPFITHAIYATNKLQAERPGVLRHFLAAWYESVAYSNTHKAETVKTIQPIINLSTDWLNKVYDVEKPMFPTDGHYDQQALKIVAQSLIDTDQMDAGTDPNRLITEQYLP